MNVQFLQYYQRAEAQFALPRFKLEKLGYEEIMEALLKIEGKQNLIEAKCDKKEYFKKT